MKLLKFYWVRYDVLVSKGLLFIYFLILILLSESIISVSFFKKKLPSIDICHFLQKKNFKIENVFLCSSSFYKGFTLNDWNSLGGKYVESNEKNGKGVKKGMKKEMDLIKNDDPLNIIMDTNNTQIDENLIKKSKLIFKKLDINNSNLINFNEYKENVEILSNNDEVNTNILISLFQLFDVNKDQKLNYYEFLSLNSFDFNYIELVEVLFGVKTTINEDAILEYLEVYFSELLDNILEEKDDIFIEKKQLIYLFSNYFFKNRSTWDLNEDEKLQINEFQNFQTSLLLEVYLLIDFLKLDYNLDGTIDISELLLYLSNDETVYDNMIQYIQNNKDKKDIFNYIRESLHIDESIILNLQFYFFSFDINEDMLLDIEEYKNQIDTFSVLHYAPELIYTT